VSTQQIDTHPDVKTAGRKVGYGIAVVINVILLIFVQNILEWGWLRFLTEEFEQVIPWISFSLVISIVVNLIYQFDDTPTTKSIGNVVTNVISLFVTARILQVFPFDFSTYDFDWEIVVRVMLILGIIGTSIATIVELVKLTSRGRSERREATHGNGT